MTDNTFDIEITQRYVGVELTVSFFIDRVRTRFLKKSTLFIEKQNKVKMYKNNVLYLETIKNKNPDYKIIVLLPKTDKAKIVKFVNDNVIKKPEQLNLFTKLPIDKEIARKHLQNIKHILNK